MECVNAVDAAPLRMDEHAQWENHLRLMIVSRNNRVVEEEAQGGYRPPYDDDVQSTTTSLK